MAGEGLQHDFATPQERVPADQEQINLQRRNALKGLLALTATGASLGGLIWKGLTDETPDSPELAEAKQREKDLMAEEEMNKAKEAVLRAQGVIPQQNDTKTQ